MKVNNQPQTLTALPWRINWIEAGFEAGLGAEQA
jgi:hypothetical protein